MFVCCCAFDKTISLLDFFSGDLIAQVSGHSELITGVRFSPDGRHIISIGGDGCIMQWRLGESLVKAMQDRLMELYSTAQRRQQKAILKHTMSIQGTPAPPPPPESAMAGIMPPPPPTDHHAPASRWASRVAQEGGYEIFGKKVTTDKPPDKNKFTLVLSETVMNDGSPYLIFHESTV